VVLDRAAHDAEIRRILEIPAERFGLVIASRNISFSEDYQPDDQVGAYTSSATSKPIKDRLLALARYEPGSFSTMIRTMSAHLRLRKPFLMSTAPDQETALKAVRRAIDQKAGTVPKA
jgi:hypothetical protein